MIIKTVPLSQVLEFIRGITFKPEDKVKPYSDGSVVCMRTKNIQTSLDESDILAVPEEFIKRDEQYLTEGDLLISSANSWELVGKTVKVPALNYKCTAGGFISILRPVREHVDSEYLYRFIMLGETQHKIRHLGKKTTNISNLDRKRFLELQIPLPPLPIQKQIATVLEKADTLRRQCQQMEQELNTLAQSVFLDMFGDYRKANKTKFILLGDCADVCSGVTKGQKFNGKPTTVVPYMRVANVQDGYLDLNEIKEIEVKVTDYEKYLLKPNDILMTEGGDHDKLGRGAVWDGQIEGCIHQNHVFRVRLNAEYLPKYFEYLLQSQYAKQYFLKCAKKTTNLASINITQLRSLPMPDATVESQQQFVDFIAVLDKQKELTLEAQSKLNSNLNSLMQRAFKGELNFANSSANPKSIEVA